MGQQTGSRDAVVTTVTRFTGWPMRVSKGSESGVAPQFLACIAGWMVVSVTEDRTEMEMTLNLVFIY